MNVFIKTFVLLGLLVGVLSAPLFADGDRGKKANEKSEVVVELTDSTAVAKEFYFPEFDASMKAFWGEMKPMHNSCDAWSWLGGSASATCIEAQNCVCTTSFVSAECHCEQVQR